ncbi:G kinase-anchoring protein 1 isoform X2 [Anabrus simplex]|uniref:G kinase-anchoring protein 1 isoform X2 n=1 Tax=Anabrus simplex TaxID=316456 RepID=UPI0034DD1A3C
MATAVASRFAVLSIDDDDDYPKKNQQKKKADPKKVATSNQSQSSVSQKKKTKKNDPGKGSQPTSTNNKSKGKSGGTKGDSNKDVSNSQKKKTGGAQDQWDQWKKKDVEFVDGNYENDLQQAILLSKLDYEEKKDVYDRLKKDAEEERKTGNKKTKKSQKAQPMSLEQFNNMNTDSAVSDEAAAENGTPAPAEAPDPQFFNRIEDEAKKVLDREQVLEQRKAREPFIQEVITVAQLQDSLEKRNKENTELKEEIVKLKEELHNVKTRNKKLCQILAQGEMRDKAEVLMEVERLQQMREELTTEVTTLHAQLEQERSKVRALTADPKSKSQNKKRTASDSAQ